ncbi:hypothetical protein ACFXKJ_36700 [Kitasatospora indigofera]|uniref:hypothetical protein n=1 Tax=Kitasatospora indigofera TaxID=67307 RepID=UPI0036BAE7B6
MSTVKSWAKRIAAVGAVVAVAIPVSVGSAGAETTAEAQAQTAATASVPVGYNCYVEFPGGHNVLPYSLTFATKAPAKVAPHKKFTVELDPPVITPNPQYNSGVKDVQVQYQLPANASLVKYELVGGSGLAGTHAVVTVDYGTNTLTYKQAGTLAAGQPFDLPTLKLKLESGASGVINTGTAGTSFDDPAFTWVRLDLQGAPAPFKCVANPQTTFTTTTVR